MAYFAPYIDDSGYHYPTYNEILEDLVSDMQTIYGSGIYLGTDSQDYQLLSKFAEKIYDAYQTGEIVFNAYSPATALGVGLDYIVALNGISRKQATNSTVTLTLRGSAGTRIENGIVSDTNGNTWELPARVTIGEGGSVMAEAVCREPGQVQAAVGSVTNIMTPTLGWESVTNESVAFPGISTEADSALRARQAASVASPSQSMRDGLEGALASLANVSRCIVYENDTKETDSDGIPANSISAVVEGGSDEEVAQTILYRKSMGCGTYGTTSVDVVSESGYTDKINFFRPEYVDVDVEINISRRPGYKASTPDEIKNAVSEYLNTFSIGTDLTTSIIWMIAQQVNEDYRTPVFAITSVKAGKHEEQTGVEDIPIAYNEVARGSVANIQVNVT